ncbi:DNA (cytosine-5-)-methyltransferase [Ensifer sp. MPMI2T]|nr:DNA (cytosine-5-)-methyltransferase [Ensifer sp. MPMI2T]
MGRPFATHDCIPFVLPWRRENSGGFSLGLEATGYFETAALCEISKFPQKVLKKNWPEVPIYEDVTKLNADTLRRDGIGSIDVITGGFPCQDISTAGKQAGIKSGTRSGLWSEIDRLVGELRPKLVIVENVANLLAGPSERPGAWFGRVLGDLAERGYDAEWENIPASALGASHRRERVWVVAYSQGLDGKPICPILGREVTLGVRSWWVPEPDVGRVANGVPDGAHRLKGLGNAVVPYIPEFIGHRIARALGLAANDNEPTIAAQAQSA